MLIDSDALLGWPVPDARHSYSTRDTILYALGLGLGAQPTDANELRFTYEKGLEALPMMSLVLGYPGLWIADPRIGADWKALLHGEQSFTMFRPLPPAGTVIGKTRITDVVDKGAQKGLFVYSSREVIDEATGELLCRLGSTAVLRKDGGGGSSAGSAARPSAPHRLPERAPDHSLDMPTLPQAALIYRLSGDYNPLHVDPAIAAAANFPRPILHGMCTFGVAGVALLKSLCGHRAERLTAMASRFTSPAFPGETIRTDMWDEGDHVSFRCTAVERQVIVLDGGRATVTRF